MLWGRSTGLLALGGYTGHLCPEPSGITRVIIAPRPPGSQSPRQRTGRRGGGEDRPCKEAVEKVSPLVLDAGAAAAEPPACRWIACNPAAPHREIHFTPGNFRKGITRRRKAPVAGTRLRRREPAGEWP